MKNTTNPLSSFKEVLDWPRAHRLAPFLILYVFYFSAVYVSFGNFNVFIEGMRLGSEARSLVELGYRFNVESYNTQLELWEFASDPTPERAKIFSDHKAGLKEKFLSFSQKMNVYYLEPDSESRMLLLEMKFYFAELDRLLDRVSFEKIQSKDDPKLIALMRALDLKVDTFDLDKKIDRLVELQILEADQIQKKNSEQNFFRLKVSFVVLTMTTLLLTFVLVFHRRREKKLFSQLVQAEKLTTLGQMSAGVAHELNNPLMVIGGYSGRVRAALKKKNFSDNDIFDYLDEIDDGIARMTSIIGHLRDFARSSSRKKEKFDPNLIVQRAFDFFNEQLQIKDIQVKLNISSAPAQLKGSSNRLEQVFINLISNARDAMVSDAGVRERKITATSSIKDNQWVLYFADTGPGILPKQQRHLFEPFFTTKPVGLGTGLGLSIVQEIVAEHQGEIVLDTKYRDGAAFIISIPLHLEQ